MSTHQPHIPPLAEQVALVTGAGGNIGGAIARRLARDGVRLVLADLRPEPLAAVRETLPDTDPLLWSGDLTNEAAVGDLFAQIHERFGRLDIAVNAAGVLRTTPFPQITKAEWDTVMDANVGSMFLVCRHCWEPMRAQQYGRIINFSSISGQVGGILAGAHYSAAKAAVISLTKTLAKQLAPLGVRCNAIAPSGVDTDMLRMYSEEQRESLRQGIPVGRFGTPEEIAELVAWLSSPGADFITGQTLSINGGAYLG